jgi:hypothetical protein
MKRVLIALILLWPFAAVAVTVNNVGTSPEDSLSIIIYCTDSLGNPIAADSFFVLTIGPSGDSLFSERITAASPRIDSSVMDGFVLYQYRAAVADLDGSGTGAAGVYEFAVTAKHNVPLFRNTFHRGFQVIEENPSAWGDSIGLAARSSQQALDSLALVLDSLYAVLDSLQHGIDLARISGDPLAADALEAMLDGTGGVNLSLGHIAVLATDNDSAVVLRGAGTGVGLAVHSSGGSPFSQPTKLDLAASIWNLPFEFPLEAGSIGDSLTSPAFVQGEAASIDSAAIANWIWNTPQANHSIIGTFGSYLDADISGIGGGSGLYSVTLIAMDSSAAQVIPYATLVVRNEQQTALLAVGGTNIDGAVRFALDAGTYTVLGAAPGFVFESSYSIGIFGPTVDTIFVTRFDPGQPLTPALCRVYAYLTDPSGLPVPNAEITATLPEGVTRSGEALVSPGVVSAVTDSAGFFALDLIPSSHLLPDTTHYEISIAYNGATILRERLLVPDQTTWRLSW